MLESARRRQSKNGCAKMKAKTRHDLGREEFLRRVLEWQDKHGGIIIQQLKRLGCSCDWSRQRYTFDDGLRPRGLRECLSIFTRKD